MFRLLSVSQTFSCIAILVMSILVLSCSSDQESQNSPDPTVEATTNQITVVDALGETLTFDVSPTNIATLSPTATEILYAAGGSAILRDRASNFPVEVQELPDVGSAYNPSIEAVVTAKPDLVIIESLTQARFAPILKQAGLTVMAVKAETVSDITNHIINVGRVIGKQKIATAYAAEITQRLEEAGTSDDRTFLMSISDHDRNLYAARPESYSGLIAATLGLQNKAEGLPDSGPYPGFSLMSTETILLANPDVIVTITPAPEPAPRLSETITRIPPFAALKAIQAHSIFEADVTLFLQAPGPRIVDAVESLAQGLKFENR